MTPRREPNPPRFARGLLEALLPPGARTEAIVGDLHEEFERRVGRRPVAARARYCLDAAGIAWRYAWVGRHRMGGGGEMDESGRDGRGVGRRRGSPLQDFAGDVRYALRGLRRNPGFTAVALLTLALGVGANTAVFTVVNGVLLRPLPYPQPEELVLLHESNPRSGEMLGRVSFQDLNDWRARARAVVSMAGFAPVPMILTGRGNPLEVETTYVTAEFFEILGVRAEPGRSLQDEDHRLAQRNAVISHSLWRSVFGGDAGVIGTSVSLSGEPYTVVGVMPASMHYPTPETDVWIPHSLVPPNVFSNGMPTRADRYLDAFGRLAPGTDAATASRELTRLSAELAAAYPDTNRDWTAAAAVPLHRSIVGDVDRALMIVLGVSGLILLIGCANLANLLLARGSVRQRELAVRASLGAGRGRVVRQLLTENLLLALIGGALGLALSYQGVRSLIALSADTLPRIQEIQIDGRVVGFALVLSLVTGTLFGLVPALRMAQADPQRDLRGARGAIGGEGQRLRSALVVTEVALAVLLLIGAGLMGRSFLALRSVDPGFEPEQVLTATLQMNLAGVPEEEVAGFLVQRREEILSRARELPGVESAGMINVFPLRDGSFSMEYTPADAPPDASGVLADTRYVDPGYLETMRIPLLGGESLPSRLDPDEPVPVVMSESAARRLWPAEDPIGQRIDVPWGESTVVGVVGDVRQTGLAMQAQPAVYFPQLIAPRLMATLVVRTSGEPAALAGGIRALVQEIDPDQPIRSIEPLEELMADSIAQDRFYTLLFAVFGALGLVLASIGVYGVLAYSVRQRTQEIGVRVALGASAADVLRLVNGDGMKVVGLGLLIGSGAALLLSRVLASQLYGIAPTDALSFAFAVAFLTAAAQVAIWVPARRALQVPPMSALRE